MVITTTALFLYFCIYYEIDMILQSPTDMKILLAIMSIPHDLLKNKLFTYESDK